VYWKLERLMGGMTMKAIMLVCGNGPLVILTSYESATHPALVERLMAKGINKFLAYEIPLELARERYGGHYHSVTGNLRESDDLRVLDYNGHRIFELFRFDELGPPVIHEP
jgi:hypothetical protein